MRRVSRSPRSQSPSRAATQSACFRAEEHVDSPLASQAEAGCTRNSEQTAAPSNLKLSLDSIHKVLAISQVFPLVHPARRKTLHPYSRLIPRDRVHLNTCKIAQGCYQYTTADDNTRYRVLAIVERIREEIPFPMQRVQTDRGREFFVVSVQQWLMDHCIKFPPIKPHHRT